MEVPAVKIVDQDAIHIPENRIRREFNPEQLEELAHSIAGSNRLGIEPKGLLHPIVVAYGFDLGYELVAGERRLRTMMLLHKQGKAFTCEGQVIPKNHIPFTLIGDLSPEARREAELEENTVRADLTWQETQAARAELHKLRVSQHGEGTRGAHNKGWSMQDTAKELGLSREGSSRVVRDALVLSEHMDDEEVATAKNPKEALKILKKKSIKFLTNELAKQLGDEAEVGLDFRNVDLREAIFTLPDDSFDCIVTDPPYGIDAQAFGSQTQHGHQYDDSPKALAELMQLFTSESFRIAKKQAHLYMFCDLSYFYIHENNLEKAGWKVWPRPLIWDKGSGMLPVPDQGPRYTYECILYANKGYRPVTSVFPDVIRCPAVDGKVSIHAAQKPVEVFENLINRCCAPGDTVFDGFAGSGTIFQAAKKTKTIATGFEGNEDHYNAALVKLKE